MTALHFDSLKTVPFEYIAPAEVFDHERVLPTTVQDLFIGSGPGSSVVASYLAKAGRQVVLLEEGPALGVFDPRRATARSMHADARIRRCDGGEPLHPADPARPEAWRRWRARARPWG